MDVGDLSLTTPGPGWYQQVREVEEAAQLERDQQERESGTKAATELDVQLRQLLPQAIAVHAHYQVSEVYGGRATVRTIVPWAELRLAEDVAVRIKARGNVWEIWSPEPKASWDVSATPPNLLLHKLARVLDDVRKARAQQEEAERRAAAMCEENETRRAAAEASALRRLERHQAAVARAGELGVLEVWVPWPEAEETEEEYLARVDEALREPLAEMRRQQLQQELQAVVDASFTPLKLYLIRWARWVDEDGEAQVESAWSVKSEPDGEGFYPVLSSGQVRRRKIVLASGAIDVEEHIFQALREVPFDAKVWEDVTAEVPGVRVGRLAWCLRP